MSNALATRSTLSAAEVKPAAITEFLVGPDLRGPAKCIKCRKPFREGEAWRRLTSPADPKHGTYSIGIHDECFRQQLSE